MESEREASEVATALVRRLEAGAELVDRGRFSLDFARARDKLAEYRQADPNAFVLHLVEAAHLLPGCREIAFTIDARRTRVRLAGARLSASELRSLFDAVFVDLGSLDSESARRELGRQRIALAVDAGSAYLETSVELRANSTDQREVVVRSDAAGLTIDEVASEQSASPAISLVFVRRRSDGSDRAEQRDLIRDRARYARLPVVVDGRRVDVETPLADVVEPVEVTSSEGTPLGRAGWSPARLEPATIVLVANGVIVEELPHFEWRDGFVALVDASDLHRDLSLAKLVRDEAFAARVAAVRAAHDRIDFAPAIPVLHARSAPSHLGSGFVLLGMVAIFGWMVEGPGLGFAVFGVAAAMLIWEALGRRRDAAARDRALRGVAVIESVTEQPRIHARALALRVSVRDRAPFVTAIQAEAFSLHTGTLEPGTRVHVRVDPDDPERIWLDVPTEQ
jgi:hypothetical protein